MAEVMIPPWVTPESPETIRWIDDATQAFPPAFGRGSTQRGIWADPRWGLRRRYRGLRAEQKSAILACLSESRGQYNVIRVTPHTPLRGSFATSELLSSGQFSSGTTGWTTASDLTLTVSDRIGRLTRNTAATGQESALYTSSGVPTVANAPYAMRYFIQEGRGTFSGGHSPTLNGVTSFGPISTSFGMTQGAVVRSETSVFPGIAFYDNASGMIGDYYTVPYLSYARCGLVDAGVNVLTQSEDVSHADWTKNQTTVVANAIVAPDGATTGDQLYETVNNTGHNLQRAVTVSSSATDISMGVAARAGTGRNIIELLMIEATSSTVVRAYFLLGGPSVGTTATGANWANLRSVIYHLGNGWYYCGIVARKTNAATTVNCFWAMASADGTDSYAGNALNYLGVWRPTVSFSSVFSRLVRTTTSDLTSGSGDNSGGGLYSKGWPVSTNGLLLTNDWIEINGELKQLTAPVNSDAAGLSYLRFRPGMAGSPSDNDPVIVHQPFGRFIYPAGTKELENLFGIYGDCEMNLEEIYV